MKLIDVLNSRMSFSFEVFPPKTDAGLGEPEAAIHRYWGVRPACIGRTDGAGGSPTNTRRWFASRLSCLCRSVIISRATAANVRSV